MQCLLLEYSFDEFVRSSAKYGAEVVDAIQAIFAKHLALFSEVSTILSCIQDDRDAKVEALQEDLAKELLTRERIVTEGKFDNDSHALVESNVRPETFFTDAGVHTPIPALPKSSQTMPLASLRSLIKSLFNSREHDLANATANLPVETIEQHLFTFFMSAPVQNKRFGLVLRPLCLLFATTRNRNRYRAFSFWSCSVRSTSRSGIPFANSKIFVRRDSRCYLQLVTHWCGICKWAGCWRNSADHFSKQGDGDQLRGWTLRTIHRGMKRNINEVDGYHISASVLLWSCCDMLWARIGCQSSLSTSFICLIGKEWVWSLLQNSVNCYVLFYLMTISQSQAIIAEVDIHNNVLSISQTLFIVWQQSNRVESPSTASGVSSPVLRGRLRQRGKKHYSALYKFNCDNLLK